MKSPQLARYATKMLFQFRNEDELSDNALREVEERIVIFEATHPEAAYEESKKYGNSHQYVTELYGGRTHFEFVGICELIHLGEESGPEEVWYSIRKMRRPMERKHQLIPSRDHLSAFRNISTISSR